MLNTGNKENQETKKILSKISLLETATTFNFPSSRFYAFFNIFEIMWYKHYVYLIYLSYFLITNIIS